MNVIVACKQPAPTWLTIEEAADHCARGLGYGTGRQTRARTGPDVVMACAGGVRRETLEP